MPITNSQSGTRTDEIAPGIHRISTPVGDELMPGGFSFNQFVIVDDEPLLFHTGLRNMFPVTLEAVATLVDPAQLKWVAFSHFEADECGALNQWLEVAPAAAPVCSHVGALVSVNDLALRPARALGDGESLRLGAKSVTWIDTPHLPHGMDAGYMFETTTRTLLCGDLFAQPGSECPAITESADDVWGASEALRQGFPYAPIANSRALIEKLAATEPQVLACMHGSSYRGDGANLLRRLGDALEIA